MTGVVVLPWLLACFPTKAPRLGRPDAAELVARAAVDRPEVGGVVPLPPIRISSWPAPPDTRHPSAIVLSGGGLRGAFQAGVLTRLLSSPTFQAEHRIDHVYGVSVGALNGALTGLSVARMSCPGCWPADERPGEPLGVSSPKVLDPWTPWRTWSAVEDYRFFQSKGRYDRVARTGFLFDLRPLRLAMDEMLGVGTLYRTGWNDPEVDPCVGSQHLAGQVCVGPANKGPPGGEAEREAFAAACQVGLEWPVLHVGYVPYADGIYRSVGYDHRREADRSCVAAGAPGAVLPFEVGMWLRRCGPYQEAPESCAEAGGAECCVESAEAFKDAMWASAAQPLLHNPVPIDPTFDGPPYTTRQREAYQRGGRPQLWNSPRPPFWRSTEKHWAIERGELDLTMDGGVRDVFPILEALASGADRVFVIGNVPAQRPDCISEYARELGSGLDRTLKLLFRSVLELTIAEVYNTDLVVARELTDDISAHNRDRRALLTELAALIDHGDPSPWEACELDPSNDRACLMAQLHSLDTDRCAFQTVSDAALVALAERALRDEPPSTVRNGLIRRLPELASLPASAYDDWAAWPEAMSALRTIKERHVGACVAGLAVETDAARQLTPTEASALEGRTFQAGYRHVPEAWLALPDRYPGDPLDQVHHELNGVLRDGWHRASHMVPLPEYSAPEACVADPVCSTCGEEG